jgi:hypothetical protein
MELNGYLHALAALLPWKEPLMPLGWETGCGGEKYLPLPITEFPFSITYYVILQAEPSRLVLFYLSYCNMLG